MKNRLFILFILFALSAPTFFSVYLSMEKKSKAMYSSIIADEEENENQKESSVKGCGEWGKEKFQVEDHGISFHIQSNTKTSYFFISGKLSLPFISYITPPPKFS